MSFVFPNKFEDLNYSVIVLSSFILNEYKLGERSLEKIFTKLHDEKSVNLNLFLDIVLFLWASKLVKVDIDHYQLV